MRLNNNVYIFVDRFSKASVSIPYKKTVIVKEIAKLYYTYVYRYYDLLDLIVLDRGLQFVLVF